MKVQISSIWKKKIWTHDLETLTYHANHQTTADVKYIEHQRHTRKRT